MITYREFMPYVWRFVKEQKGRFTTIFVLDCLAWPLDSILWPLILRMAIDIFGKYDGNRMAAWKPLTGPIVFALSLVLFVEVASRTMGFIYARAVPRMQASIRMQMFDHVLHHTPRYFNERFAGALANKVTDMTTQVEKIIEEFFWPILPALSSCVLGVVFLWFVNPIFSAILFGWTAVHTMVSILFTKSVDRYEHKHGEERSKLLGKVVDAFTNNFAVNLFYRFSFEKKRIFAYQEVEEKTNWEARSFVEKMRCVLSVFYFSFVIIGVFGFLLYLWVHGKISTGEVVQVFTFLWSYAFIMWNVGTAFPILFQAFGIAKQAYSVLLDPSDLGDQKRAKDLVVSQGEIVFHNVSFHYGEKDLFVNKNATIKGGEKVGLVGYTGAGKSTFVNLILRFHPVHSGEICIDGQSIANATLESIRRQIALIPQEPVLFHRTLKENIAYGNPEASDEALFRAAKLAHCDEFIQSLPKGYDTRVGERGTKLSGGEKQRIAIARALLSNAPILILDEATSALDSVTERYIQDSLEKLMEGRTTIAIAHRLSTLSHMDRLLVFRKGKIVEEGSHEELLAMQGFYTKMWHMQVNGFLPDNPV